MNCTENQTKESDSRMNPSLIIGIGQHVSHDTQTKKSLLDYYFSKSFNKKGKQTLECKLRAKKKTITSKSQTVTPESFIDRLIKYI